MRNDMGTWVMVAAGVALVAYLKSTSSAQTAAAPLSIYPSLAWTNVTSMAATPGQKATTAPVPPTGLFTSVQQQEQSAVLSQCAGSYPSCTPMTADTQLGF